MRLDVERPDMTDLATALQQVLRQVREDTQHSDECLAEWRYYPRGCACDFGERVEAEQARRMYHAIDAAGRTRFGGDEAREYPAFWYAAIKAAQQERGDD